MNWIDMHCDTLSELMKRPKEETLRKNQLCVDLERLQRSGAKGQFFACYVNAAAYEQSPEGKWEAAYHEVERLINQAEQEELVTKKEQLLKKEDSVKGILTVEEGGVLNGEMERLKHLYEREIRLVTLTWNYENCIGSPNSRDAEIMQQGLKPFGIEVVHQMNELGMLVDVSHLSDGGFWDCIHYSKAPIVASHSNCRALCNHPRNLTDEMLHALGEKGGVAGLNFYSRFLKETEPESEKSVQASMEELAAHAVHIINKAGEDAVALGTDFDGFESDALPEGIHGVQDMELVWNALERAKLTPRQIEKLACRNVERVLREVCGI